MSLKKVSRGVSKKEWLEAALQSLSDRGVAGLSVQGLARSLGIAKAGFYWHFKDRDDLLRQLLKHWVHELTEVIATNPQVLALEPKDRLTKCAKMILEHNLARYDLSIRQWALKDARVARAVRKADRIRFTFVREAFSELGFTGDNLDMRTMLFACYYTWESTMFRQISRTRRGELIAEGVNLLTRK